MREPGYRPDACVSSGRPGQLLSAMERRLPRSRDGLRLCSLRSRSGEVPWDRPRGGSCRTPSSGCTSSAASRPRPWFLASEHRTCSAGLSTDPLGLLGRWCYLLAVRRLALPGPVGCCGRGPHRWEADADRHTVVLGVHFVVLHGVVAGDRVAQWQAAHRGRTGTRPGVYFAPLPVQVAMVPRLLPRRDTEAALAMNSVWSSTVRDSGAAFVCRRDKHDRIRLGIRAECNLVPILLRDTSEDASTDRPQALPTSASQRWPQYRP